MDKKIEKTINHFLENNISEKDLDFLKEWIKNADNKDIFRDYVYQYYKDYPFDFEKSIERFESNISKIDALSSKKKGKSIVFFRYAAILIGLMIAIMGLFHFTEDATVPDESHITLELEDGSIRILNQSEVQNIATDGGSVLVKQNQDQLLYSDGVNENSEIVYNSLRVPNGKTFRLRLSDNSEIYLNAGSKIKYPVQFIKDKPREVFLEGEGYFKISKNKKSPFIVNANGLNTEVFGTEFNISSYANDDFTEVVLVEGSVGVFVEGNRFTPEGGVKLKPNERAYKPEESVLEVNQVDIGQHIAWINGNLFFNNENFGSIIKKIERHFDLKIINNYKLLEQKKFTGKFDSENIEQILLTFQKTNNFSYTKQEDKIVINP